MKAVSGVVLMRHVIGLYRCEQDARRGNTEEKASKHAERLFKMIDIDGDGTLTETEFLRVSSHFNLNFSTNYLIQHTTP